MNKNTFRYSNGWFCHKSQYNELFMLFDSLYLRVEMKSSNKGDNIFTCNKCLRIRKPTYLFMFYGP